jgi:hypothetical protein
MKDEATTAWPTDGTVESVGNVEGHDDREQRAETRHAYWQEWYDANRQRIAEKRSRLWREDPEYRARENARRRKQRRAAAAKRAPRPTSDPWFTAEVRVGERSEKAYTLGYVARQLGCSEALLRQWRLRGQLPESPYRDGRRHLYTEDMVAAIVAARDRRVHERAGRMVVGEDASMGAEIMAAWEKSSKRC